MRYRDYCRLVLKGRSFEDTVVQFNICTHAQLSAFIARAELVAGTQRWHERLFNDMYEYV